MAIKQDIEAIKEEIGAEEQFLESLIKGERFFKRYRYPIIGIVVFVLLVIIGYSIVNFIQENRLIQSNEAYNILLKEPANKEALSTLQSNNSKLYEAYLFQKAVQSKNKEALKEVLSSNADSILKDIAHFVLQDGNSKMMREVNFLLEGYGYLQKGNLKEAKTAFSNIPLSSPLQELVNKLNHYQGK